MASVFACFEPLEFIGVQDDYELLQGYAKDGGMSKGQGQKTLLFGSQDLGNGDYFSSQYGLYQQNMPQEEVISFKDTYKQNFYHETLPHSFKDQPQHHQPVYDFTLLDDFQFNDVSTPFQSPQQSLSLDMVFNEFKELVQVQAQEKPYASSNPSLELLNTNGLKRLKTENLNVQPVIDSQRLSTEEVMRVAGAQYIQSSTNQGDTFSMHMNPFGSFGYSSSGLTAEETKDVQLAHFLLAAAEKVGNQQFDRAGKLLAQCDYLSSSIGSPVQRVVYYFAEALRERIFRETGGIPFRMFPVGVKEEVLDVNEAMLSPNAEILAAHQALPFSQMLQFPGVQAIIENVVLSRKVHLIDLGIKIGVQWIVLMQALAARYEYPIQLFKITAVGISKKETIIENKRKIEETGKRLATFAKSVALPFSFKVIMVSDVNDIKEDLFNVGDDETITVYAPFILKTMINRPDRLDSLLRVIRNFDPCIMIVIEVEANHNSPSFFNRFIEGLFFYGAFFDCLEACMDRNNPLRTTMEGNYFGQWITNMVSTEGEERTHRHVGIDVWRAFFSRFGWVEAEFSHSSMYQASLLLKQVAGGNSCTLGMNGKCLTVGWKGTPIHSLSAWKLSNLRI